MSTRSSGVLGIFNHPMTAKKGVIRLRDLGLAEITVLSPCASHEIEEAIGAGVSRVRWFTLTGAIIGGIFGFGLSIYTSVVWSQIVSGKPVVSIPPFIIIAFEMTVLFGGLATFLGMLLCARLPQLRFERTADERFTGSKIGLFVACAADNFSKAQEAMRDAGAEEVSVETS